MEIKLIEIYPDDELSEEYFEKILVYSVNISMSKPKFKNFKVPKKILDELYEVNWRQNNYKGFIIAYATENGEPVVYTKCDTQMTEYAYIKH